MQTIRRVTIVEGSFSVRGKDEDHLQQPKIMKEMKHFRKGFSQP